MNTGNITFLLLLTTLLLFSSSSAQTSVTNEPFDPTGGYHPVQRPEGSPDKFLHFALRLERSRGKRIISGEVRGVGAWYRFKTSAVDAKGIRFVTDAIENVRYQFEGAFTGKGDYARQWAGTELLFLKGRLTKYVDGRKAWEIDTPFAYYPPH